MVGEFGEVQIMDWGLAKVISDQSSVIRSGEGESGANFEQPTSNAERSTSESELRRADTVPAGGEAGNTAYPVPNTSSSVRSVRTDSDVALTVDGQITGTPAYMPPEQAEGKLELIDHRSDVYSLGAILYEILTLERPIEGDTVHKVLLNVSDGKITPPGQRTPHRHIPKELSAVVMKAMAKNRRKRYQSVQDLSQDIKLFLEGRSVSAREDSFVESVVKLVKRNKGISLSLAGAAAVLLFVTAAFIIRLNAALDRAVTGEQQAREAQEKRKRTALEASERFAGQAIRAGELAHWEEAETRAGDAIAVAPDGPWGLYARGRLQQLRNHHEEAEKLLRQALEKDGAHEPSRSALVKSLAFLKDLRAVQELLEGKASTAEWADLIELGKRLYEAERWREALGAIERGIEALGNTRSVTPDKKASVKEELEPFLVNARAWIACEGFADTLRDLPPEEQVKRGEAKLSETHGKPIRAKATIEDGELKVLDLGGQPVEHIVPLRGLQIERLAIRETGVSHLHPLKGMSLKYLDCLGTSVGDLGPLKGMPLSGLRCDKTLVSDLRPLRGAPLTYLQCDRTEVTDLRPLKGMALTELRCVCVGFYIADIGPLQGMPLTHLDIRGARVTDWRPLKGMPLTVLHVQGTQFSDLGLLEGMRLWMLDVGRTPVNDLGPLKGMPIRVLVCHHTEVRDLAPLRGMHLLREVVLNNTPVSDLGPLRGMRLQRLYMHDTLVTDLTPLEGMELGWFRFTPAKVTKGIETVRRMKSLEEIAPGDRGALKPAEFWKKYDAGEFK